MAFFPSFLSHLTCEIGFPFTSVTSIDSSFVLGSCSGASFLSLKKRQSSDGGTMWWVRSVCVCVQQGEVYRMRGIILNATERDRETQKDTGTLATEYPGLLASV